MNVLFRWFEFHKRLMLLNEQSVLEISALREESTKEWFVSLGKVKKKIFYITIFYFNIFFSI